MVPLAPYVLPKKDWERSRVSERLVHAGIRSPSALTNFYMLKTILVILLPGLVVMLAPLFPHATMNHVIFAVSIAGFLGVAMPNLVLERMKQRRMKRIRNGFPDALDLLVVCSEAGLGLNAAIDRVGQELEATHPDLAEELALVNAETRAGVERLDALRNLAKRTGLEDIRGLVALLTQSHTSRVGCGRYLAYLLRGIPGQAHAKGRGTGGEDRHQDDLSPGDLPVSGLLRGGDRSRCIENYGCVQRYAIRIRNQQLYRQGKPCGRDTST